MLFAFLVIAHKDPRSIRKSDTLVRLYVNEKCADCDFTYGPTTYTLTDGDHYVVKAGTASNNMVIANKINGIPVTEIAPNAFKDKTIQGEIVIPASITKIGSKAFSGSAFTKISLEEGSKLESIGQAAFAYIDAEFTLNVPDSVTSIGLNAFGDCKALSSISIPSGVKSIGSSAFDGCTSLASIQLPEELTSLGQYAFRETGLTSLVLPEKITEVPADLCEGCVALKSVTFGSAVTKIGSYAFKGCAALESVTFPASLTTLNGYTFQNSGISSITFLGNSVTKLGYYDFSDCNNLTEVSLPDSITKISTGTFADCANLVSVTVGSGVTSLPMAMFRNTTKLERVILRGNTMSAIGSQCFNNSSVREIYFGGSEDEWNNFALGSLNTPAVYFYSETEPAKEGSFWHYNENGEVVPWAPDVTVSND